MYGVGALDVVVVGATAGDGAGGCGVGVGGGVGAGAGVGALAGAALVRIALTSATTAGFAVIAAEPPSAACRDWSSPVGMLVNFVDSDALSATVSACPAVSLVIAAL